MPTKKESREKPTVKKAISKKPTVKKADPQKSDTNKAKVSSLDGLSCSECGVLACRFAAEENYPKFCLTEHINQELLDDTIDIYKENPDVGEISRVSACIEGEFYGKFTRVEETVEFIRRMGYKKIGIASCVGLLREVNVFAKILKAYGLDVYTVGCKIGAIDKTEIGVPEDKKLNKGTGHESMCNPIMQAKELAAHGTEFNIVVGLCVGHDTLFLKYSEAPTTVMIVKDRVLGHNPVQALYIANGMYSRFKDIGL